MASYVGTGTTATFGTSGFSGDLLNVDWGGISREQFQTSHMGTTVAHTYKPVTLKDPGEITLEFAFEPTLDIGILDDAAETLTIDWAAIGTTWAASVFCTNVDIVGPLEEKMMWTMTLKVTGNITVT